jgi:prepilin-type processing-associated H-X9-DG protein
VRTLAILLVAFVLLAVFTTISVPLTLLFGWIGFLVRVLPQVRVDRPSVAVGCAALVLFAAGVHWMGKGWARRFPGAEGAAQQKWKRRWSLTIVAAVCLLFAAGVALVGIVHQAVWLINSPEPLLTEKLELRHGGNSANNLEWIGSSAVGDYASDHGQLPAGAGPLRPGLAARQSWAVALLPYLGYSWQGIDFDRPWNDPKNQKYFKCILPQYINTDLGRPPLQDTEGYGLCHYAANVHVLNAGPAMKLAGITDGTSNTFLIGELNAQFKPWGAPGNWRDPARGINRSPYGFGGAPEAGGANFVMADGSVRFVSDKVSPSVLRALSTPRGGEGIGAEALDGP